MVLSVGPPTTCSVGVETSRCIAGRRYLAGTLEATRSCASRQSVEMSSRTNWMARARASEVMAALLGKLPTVTELAKRVSSGETITLLCSSACVREARCHRSLLKELIEEQMKKSS